MNLEIKGTIREIRDEVQVTDSFKKKEFLVFSPNPVNDKYSDVFKIELHQNNTSKLDNFQVGDAVMCQCNLQGKEWTNKDGKVLNFTSLTAWKIEAGEQMGKNEPDNFPESDDLPPFY